MNLSEITYDPSNDEILGVIGDEVHVKVYDENQDPVILILSKELFHKTFENWLKGKQDYCERWKEYCGVGGYTVVEKGKILKRKINLYKYTEDDENVIEVFTPVIKVTKFSDIHDFEHG